ncbi:MAG: hypothetical protein HY880_07380 [Deltaproteobacteria bacterium]|nr:hypothetical protein [Deltaproteobacteria bacterium]
MKNPRLVALAAVLSAALATPSYIVRAQGDPAALFEAACNLCHSSDQAKSARKTPAEWESTVLRMKNSNGCDITDEEVRIITDYLSKNYGK